MGSLTIFRSAVAESDDDALEYAVRELDATVERVLIDALRGRALPALARGAVVLIAADDRMSTLGLAAGVDEVLRAGEVTRESLRQAAERSQVRAQARAESVAHRGAASDDTDQALAFLVAAFAHQLREPLAAASFLHGLLSASLPVVFDIGDELAGWAALAAPTEELRRLVARRLAAPKSTELADALRSLGGALIRAQWVTGILKDLFVGEDAKEPVDCCALAEQLRECLDAQLKPYATLAVLTRAPCVAAVPKGALALALVSLVLRAMHSFEHPEGNAAIELEVYDAEGAVVIEVRDNGGLTRSDLRPDVLEGGLLELGTSSSRTGLAALRDRVRRWGGELLVDSDVVGTTVRLILPFASEQATGASVPSRERRQRDPRLD